MYINTACLNGSKEEKCRPVGNNHIPPANYANHIYNLMLDEVALASK